MAPPTSTAGKRGTGWRGIARRQRPTIRINGRLRAPGCLGRSDGATALEFALALPMLMALMLAIFDLGRVTWIQSALHFAVEEGARCASVTPGQCGSPGAVQAWVQNRMTSLSIPAGLVTVDTPGCGNRVQVAFPVQFYAVSFIPGVPAQVTLSAEACFPN